MNKQKKQTKKKSRPITVQNMKDALLFFILSIVSGITTWLLVLAIKDTSVACSEVVCLSEALAAIGIIFFGLFSLVCLGGAFAGFLSEEDALNE